VSFLDIDAARARAPTEIEVMVHPQPIGAEGTYITAPEADIESLGLTEVDAAA